MVPRRFNHLSAVASLGMIGSVQVQSQPPTCGMTGHFDHATNHHGVRRVHTGEGALFYTAPLAVNTDGAPTSYHPDDPRGNGGLAINTICNGANAILPDGTKINYRNCDQLIEAYRRAKAAGWTDPASPRMDFYGIASRRYVPCLNDRGYFVSRTAQPADPSVRDECEQRRYLNALELPFSKYPSHVSFTGRGVGKRDVAVVHNPVTGRTEYSIMGDAGGKRSLGEVSVFAAKFLKDRSFDPRSRRETYRLAIAKAHVLILANEQVQPPYTLEKIRREGEAAFQRWGGQSRLLACMAEHPR